MSLMLLTASFLMAASFRAQRGEGHGFAKDHLLMARFDPRLVQYDAAQTQQFYELLTERVRDDAGSRERGPHAEPSARTGRFRPRRLRAGRFSRCRAIARTSLRPWTRSTKGSSRRWGSPILQGRGFLPSDTADAPRVAIVNEQFAKHYWPGGDAVGKHIRLDEPRRSAGRDCRRRADDQVPRHWAGRRQTSCICRWPSIRPPEWCCCCARAAIPLQLVEPLKDVSDARCEHADAGDEDLRRIVPVQHGRRAASCHRAGRHHGRGGTVLAIAGLYGLVRTT